MKLLVACLAALSLATYALEDKDTSHVIELNGENFHQVVKSEDLMLVKFYTSWCPHCKALGPDYAEAAKQLVEFEIKLGRVECDENKDICAEHGIKGYPMLKVFRKGEHTDYEGQRSVAGLVNFMRKQKVPPLTLISSDQFSDFTNSEDIVVIGFLSSTEGAEYETLLSVAGELRNSFVFGVTTDEELGKEHGVEVPGIVLFTKFDDGKEVYQESLTDAEKLRHFVRSNSLPVLAEVGPENFGSYVDSELPLAYIFVENDEQRQKFGKELGPLAKKHKGVINFVYIDATKYSQHGAALNLKDSWPAFALHKPLEFARYPFDQSKEITAASIGEFVDAFLRGEVEPSLKSEPVPETNDGPVKVVVGTTYKEIVMDPSKNVLVEFYAPWCGHCRKLEPTYRRLGEEFDKAAVEHVVIAKMDATGNDLPSDSPFQIQGFPTIKLFKAGEEKEIVDFEGGDRSFNGLLKFLKEHVAGEISVEPEAEEEKEEESSDEGVVDFGEFEDDHQGGESADAYDNDGDEEDHDEL